MSQANTETGSPTSETGKGGAETGAESETGSSTDTGRAGGDRAVLADLARERESRKALQKERDELIAAKTEADRSQMDAKTRAEAERDEWKGKATGTEASLLKLEVALEAAPDSMTSKEVARLARRLTGSTKAELETDAKELFEQFGGTSTSTGKAPVSGKPQSRLRAGANNDEDDGDDSDVDVEKIPRM